MITSQCVEHSPPPDQWGWMGLGGLQCGVMEAEVSTQPSHTCGNAQNSPKGTGLEMDRVGERTGSGWCGCSTELSGHSAGGRGLIHHTAAIR